jgi:hypothetical protein
MLLSMFISFLSFCLPSRVADYPTPSYYPIPLSFPFYSIDNAHPSLWGFAVIAESYELYFLTFRITEVWSSYPLSQKLFHRLTIFYLAFTQFFLLVNFVGAIFGYWISKTTFIQKLLETKRKI